MSTLFGDEFLQSIARLRIVAKQVPQGGRHAEHRSRDLGSGMEFRDFRPYTPGDDIRRIDWNLQRRSGRLFLRLFEEPEDLAVHVLVDVSDSMSFEAPPRVDAARRMAAVLAAIGLNQFDRVGVFPFGADLVSPLAPVSGKQALPRVLSYLERLKPAGPTDLPRAVRHLEAMPLRTGLLAVISDFFDPQGIETVVEALGRLRHRLLLIQVVKAEDESPDLGGELRLVDCESSGALEVAVTPAVLERYRQAYQQHARRLEEFAKRRRAAHLRLDADRAVLAQLGSLFPDGVLVA